MGINLPAYQDEIRFFQTHRFIADGIGMKAAAFEFITVPAGVGAHVGFLRLIGYRRERQGKIILGIQDGLGETALTDIDGCHRFSPHYTEAAPSHQHGIAFFFIACCDNAVISEFCKRIQSAFFHRDFFKRHSKSPLIS